MSDRAFPSSTGGPELDALYPDDRITCGKCRRTTGLDEFDESKCPRLPKFPGDHKHRCWYFAPKAHLEDQRTGDVLFATTDRELRAWYGYREPKKRA